MANVLYLVHRLPFPPNKGDKVRSYHLLRHLAAKHRVFLGTFVDDPEDWAHVDTVRAMCADTHICALAARSAKLRSLKGLWTGDALSLGYYKDSGLAAWCARTLATGGMDATVVFSSVMAQYLPAGVSDSARPLLVDFVDVDSAKWAQYAKQHRWPLSWIYGREGRKLLAFERLLAQRAQRSFFVTANEAALFGRLAPECRERVGDMCNGVDSEYFAAEAARPSPFSDGELPIVFTGAMDYWPNIDAVGWFVAEMLPQLRRKWPALRFHIVGRSPSPAVQALASDAVVVTGTVPDVRPYLQHAAVVVAPMRLARGVQNKVLEAMAMARPVVAAQECVGAIDVRQDEEILSAGSAMDYVRAIEDLLQQPARAAAIGAAGRRCVVQRYSWDANLSVIDNYLPARAGQDRRVGAERRSA